jgi:mRNA interferase HigB
MMIIIGQNILSELVEREKRLSPAYGKTLKRRVSAWIQEVSVANWKKPVELKRIFGAADVIGGNRVIFDICGNNYRLIVKFNCNAGIALILFAGNH